MHSDADASPLISTAWRTAHLDDPGVRIVDVRWRSRYENGHGISFDDFDGYVAGHILGAVFAGMIADMSNPDHPLPVNRLVNCHLASLNANALWSLDIPDGLQHDPSMMRLFLTRRSASI